MTKDVSAPLADWDKRWHEALVELHGSLFDKKGELKAEYSDRVDCPVCGSSKSTEYCNKDGFKHRICKNCELVYISPRLNEEATHAFYNSKANEIYNESKFHAEAFGDSIDDKVNLHNLGLLKSYLGPRAKNLKLLEVGSAKGHFLRNASQEGFDVYGIELNKVNADISRRHLGQDHIFDSDLFELRLPSESFDVIYTRDVIEHIHNPMSFLKELNRILKPGGVIFHETHNIGGFSHRILRGRHTCVFGFEHPVHWSSKTLSRALNMSGFKVQKIHYDSRDFRVLRIAYNLCESTFTTIFPWKAKLPVRLALKILALPFRLPLIKHLDNFILPPLANALKRGSTMKVIATKTPTAAPRLS